MDLLGLLMLQNTIDNHLEMKDSLSPCTYNRRKSIEVHIGKLALGASNPIRLQSMASVSTMDTEGAVSQAGRIIDAGADLLRFTAQGIREAKNLAVIRERLDQLGRHTPLVADIHFSPKAADEALEHIEKVRINPGNYVDSKTPVARNWDEAMLTEAHNKVVERFGAFVLRAKELGKAIRIGVNHGSLSERMVHIWGDTPEGMVRSAIEYLEVCQQHNFTDVVISMKASNVVVMTAAVRLLAQRLTELNYPNYPLHLGVTEAGEGEDGRIKSAVGIGSLLYDGLGDTIRVSLSEDPEFEIPVAHTLVDYITNRPALGIPTELLPSWQEYDSLCRGTRLKSHQIGRSIGAGLHPQVFSSVTVDPEKKLKPDYKLTNCGTHYEALPIAELREPLKLYRVGMDNITDESYLSTLKPQAEAVILLEATSASPVAEWRYLYYQLKKQNLQQPIVLQRTYSEVQTSEEFRLQVAADLGSILLDGWGHGLCISAPQIPHEVVLSTQYGVLQAVRLRMSKTEFISCPGCGRTLYNLQDTIAKVKDATHHLKGLKIGIMGCIVNGPGEMADADYGYVGAAPGKIDLYKGQTCIRRGVPQEHAVEQLVDLIKSEGDWKEPEQA